MKTQEKDAQSLKTLYQNNEHARQILDCFRQRERSRRETSLDSTYESLKILGSTLTRFEVSQVFKEFEALDLGKFILGRKGHISRFLWSVNNVNAAKAAAGEAVKVGCAPAEPDASESKTFVGDFRLRPDYRVEINLPDDLTESEAVRIGQYVQALVIKKAA